MKFHEGSGYEKVSAQLAAAHEVIEELRHDNDHLRGAARHVLMNHNDCICRHARRALKDVLLAPERLRESAAQSKAIPTP